MTDRLLHAPGQHLATRGDQSPDMSNAQRDASEGLRHTDDQWARVTTALRPSHDYVTAARDLSTVLKESGSLDLKRTSPGKTEVALDVAQALADLNIAIMDLA